ncbi:2-oxo acid dehydrogenase subunit E2 [Desulfocastanea catecholica]
MAVEKIRIPDFGDVQEITVVEVFIKPGDKITEEDSLLTLESEKAVMDLPSPYSGVIKEVSVKEEDKVAGGDVIALIETEETAEDGSDKPDGEKEKAELEKGGEESAQQEAGEEKTVKEEDVAKAEDDRKSTNDKAAEREPAGADEDDEKQPEKEEEHEPAKDRPAEQIFHATPSVRAFARQQQVDLAKVTGTGPKGRIVKEDVLAMRQQPAAALPGQEPAPLEDFSKYGEIEEVALGRIQKISGPHLHRSWVTIPHVTHFEEADITELERFRKELNHALPEGEPTYSPLIFMIRAVGATLRQFPLFNCSLLPGGEKVILKKYYHLGIAVDTPKGLMVPVIKNVDRRGLQDLAVELQRLSSSARAGKLAIPDIQGATFTISSLGGIGGTGFTPIISSPQAAILGLSRSTMKPVWDEQSGNFVPRLILPFSVSYDHRIIDGAEAARFCRVLRMNIEDLKRTLV